MKKTLLALILFLLAYTGFSQIKITGIVQDSLTGDPLSSSSVVFYPKTGNNILGYGIADDNGKFEVSLNPKNDSIRVKVSSLGFEKYEKIIAAKPQNLIFPLAVATETLEEVFIRKPPIKQRGDTLIFDPAAFKSNKDRSIQDALAKMPGIEIQPSGEIYYQGKPINKFYVEGLDLMGGQYGMISNNLSVDKVKSVEILENHQPIKALDSIVPSDQAAINLKLKNKVTLSGNIEVGGGATPGLWYGKLTPMFFTKKFQTLVTYQTNNTGTDVNSDFSRFSVFSFRFGSRLDAKQNWLHTANPGSAPFSKKRWLDNESHAISANALFKNKNDTEFKINTSYINDFTKRRGGHKTTYLLPQGDTIVDNSTQRNGRDESFNTTLSIERNKEKSFMKENLSFNKQWDRATAFVNENEIDGYHHLKSPYTDISNQFEILFPVGNQMLTLDSDIGYNETPQDLVITPGVFEEVLNSGNPLGSVKQHLRHERFFANHSASLTKTFGKFSVNLRPGIDFSTQKMNSQLYLDQQMDPNQDFQNDMRWDEFSTYVNTAFNYKSDQLRLHLSLPFDITHYEIEDKLNTEKQSKSPFTINPSFWGEYKFWDYWKATGSTGYSKSYGPLNQMYTGFILSGYRSLSNNDVPLMETDAQNNSIGLQYRNPITSWFGRINYSHSGSKRNLIFNTITQPDGSTVTEALHQNTKTNSNSVNANISRLISPLRTTFKLGGTYSHSDSDILFNGDLVKNRHDNWSTSLNLSGDFTDWITLEYTGTLAESSTKNIILNQSKTKTQSHEFGLYLYFGDHHTINFSGEWQKNELAGQKHEDFFGDFMYRFTLSQERKIDVEFSVINIFDREQYRESGFSDFTISESYYYLRPRQFLIKVRFPL